jgi:hypothetical protein
VLPIIGAGSPHLISVTELSLPSTIKTAAMDGLDRICLRPYWIDLGSCTYYGRTTLLATNCWELIVGRGLFSPI